jgi:hypothetical protein
MEWRAGVVVRLGGGASARPHRRSSRARARARTATSRFDQQFEMVACPRNHFCYNSLTVPV